MELSDSSYGKIELNYGDDGTIDCDKMEQDYEENQEFHIRYINNQISGFIDEYQESYDSLKEEKGNLKSYRKIITNLFSKFREILDYYIWNLPSDIGIYLMNNLPLQYPWDYRHRFCMESNVKLLQFKDNFNQRINKSTTKLNKDNEDYYNNTKKIILETYHSLQQFINKLIQYMKDWITFHKNQDLLHI